MADPVNPHDTTTYGQQQEEKLQHNKAEGEIRDLYGYYRFSDHRLTNIALKEKIYKRQEVWFEGYMDWSFKECLFKAPFHFGVEGERLEEDTRGTEKNPEPFPGYGFNGLNFETCKFKIDDPELSPLFEIRNNCNVVFKGCSFEKGSGDIYPTLSTGDNCRVEFINCKFECSLVFDTFCDVKFRDCEFAENLTSYVSASDHCKLHFTNCDMNHSPENGNWMSLANDCSVVIHGGANLPSLLGKTGTISLANNCHVKIYKMKKVCCTEGIIFSLTNGSKLETFDVEEMSCGAGVCFDIANSEVYVRNTELIKAGFAAICLNDGVFRSDNVKEIRAGQGSAIDASNGSKAQIKNTESIISGKGSAVVLIASTADLADITLVQGLLSGVNASGAGRSYLRRVETVTGATESGIDLSDGVELYGYTVSTINGGLLAGVTLDSARFEITDGTTIHGPKGGIVGTQAHIRVEQVTTISGDDEAGISLADSAYDIRNVQTMSGKSGLTMSNCRGVLLDIGTISGEQEPGAIIEDCSGPTEWDTITTISSNSGDGLVVEGNLKQLRIINVDTITSTSANGVSWTQASGTAFLGHVLSITSTSEVGMTATVTIGSLTLEEVDTITAKMDALNIAGTGEVYGNILGTLTSQEGTAFSVSMSSSGKARFRDLGTLTSQEGTAASLTAQGSAEVALWAVTAPMSSQEGDAAVLTASGDSYITLRDIAGMTSEEGRPLVVTTSGTSETYIYSITSECTAVEVAAWTLTLSGQSQVTVRETAGASSEKGQAVVVNVGAGSILTMDDNTKFSSVEETAFSGTVQGTLKVNNMDEISTEEGRMIVLSGGTDSWIEFTNIPTIKGTNPSEDAVEITGSGTTRLVNIDEIDGGNLSRYIVELTSLGAELGKIEVIDVLSIKATNCRGGLLVQNCGDIEIYCTTSKGSIVCDTGSTHCLSIFSGNAVVRNFSEIKNSDGSMNGVYTYGTGRVTLENIDLMQGEHGLYAYNVNRELLVSNCPSIKAPESGQSALEISGPGRVVIQGVSPTVVEAKDANTVALKLTGNGEIRNDFRLLNVEVTASKGQIQCESLSAYFYGCQFDGSTSFTQCTGELQTTEMTVGLAVSQSTLAFYDTKIQLGTNDGPDQNLTVTDSTLTAYRSEVTGDKEVTISGSVVDFTWTTTALAGGTWTTTDSVLRGVKADWDKDIDASASSVLQFTKTDAANITLSGADQVIEGHLLTADNLSIGATCAGFMSHLTATAPVSTGADTALFVNYGALDGVQLGQANGVVLNRVTSGQTTLATDMALFVNYGALGALQFGQATGVVLNRVTSGQTTLATDIGLVMNWVDSGAFTASSDDAIIANNYRTSSNVTTSSGCGIVGARMRTTAAWNIGQDNGIISAKGSGSWSTSASGIGALFAKHDTAISAGGSNVGIIGASMAYDLTLSGSTTGIVVASQAGASEAKGVVAAYSAEVTGYGTIMAAGGDITADNGLVAAGCTGIGSGGYGCVASGGAGSPDGKGCVAIGGEYTAVSGSKGVAAVGPESCGSLTAGENAGMLALGKHFSAISTPTSGGAMLAGTEVDLTLGGSSGTILAGCSVPSGLTVTTTGAVIGAAVSSSAAHSVTGDAVLLGNQHSTGTGRAITMTSQTDCLNLGSTQQTAIKFNTNSIGLYNASGGSFVEESGDGGESPGTAIVLGANDPYRGASIKQQVRIAGVGITDLSPIIHHNYPYYDPQ